MVILKLREILWEITPECNKNCSYCGSKELAGKKQLGDDALIHIAREIKEYGVPEVAITGGEPGSVDEGLLNQIINILHGTSVVKFITNGELFKLDLQFDKVDCIGLSINTVEDTEFEVPDHLIDKTVMITNFGKHNIWDLEKLKKYSEKFLDWQVQLTMGDELLPPDGIEMLRDKLEGSAVFADNLQTSHTCSAGINTCAITYDGYVANCLSGRAYGNLKCEDNLSSKPLSAIWEEGFKCERFRGCKCCRDFIEYPYDCRKTVLDKTMPVDHAPQPINLPSEPRDYDVVLYSVYNPNRSGSWSPPSLGQDLIKMVYGVSYRKNKYGSD